MSASLRAHAGMTFMNPLSEGAVDGLIARLRLGPGADVVETGCGAAEILLRVLERHPGARGTGVDRDAGALARAREAAARRVAGREPRLVCEPADGAGLAPGAFDLVVNVASSHAHGGFPDALGTVAALTRPGGHVLFGEGFWTREPSPAFLAALGGATAAELPLGRDALISAAEDAGLGLVAVSEASAEDWRAYEETLASNAERAGGEDDRAYAARIRERRALPDGTTTFGFALLLLRRV